MSREDIDFIWVSDDWFLKAIEVKYKEKINKDNFKGLNYFEKKFKVDENIIISKNIDESYWNIKVIPFWGIDYLKNS